MTDIEAIKANLEKINQRNKRVELNKAWETSLTRKTIILIFTYIIIGLTFLVIGNKDPWINAIIPTIAFLISTLTLPFLRVYWQRYIYKKL